VLWRPRSNELFAAARKERLGPPASRETKCQRWSGQDMFPVAPRIQFTLTVGPAFFIRDIMVAMSKWRYRENRHSAFRPSWIWNQTRFLIGLGRLARLCSLNDVTWITNYDSTYVYLIAFRGRFGWTWVKSGEQRQTGAPSLTCTSVVKSPAKKRKTPAS
jgi:hypothetical protein